MPRQAGMPSLQKESDMSRLVDFYRGQATDSEGRWLRSGLSARSTEQDHCEGCVKA